MPYIRISNKMPVRNIKRAFIWLDYLEFVKGDPLNFILVVSNNSKDKKEYSFSDLTTRERTKMPRYDFHEGCKSDAIISFPKTEKYQVEMKALHDDNQPYKVCLYYK